MIYNLTLVLKSDLKDTDRNKIIAKSKEAFGKAKVTENDWGQKPLAYPIAKQVSGYYVNMDIDTEEVVDKNFEKSLYVNDNVLRHLLLRSK